MKSIFGESDNLKAISKLGDNLEVLNRWINFEQFRPTLREIYVSEDHRAGGRQRWDLVLMFKIQLLQKMYGNLSDDATEYMIIDRLSFQRFLGLELGDKVPDAKTIWKYKEELAKSGREKELFDMFNEALKQAGLLTHEGSLVDATIIERPQQRYNKEEKRREKAGEEPQQLTKKQAEQIDTDAKYTVKHGKNRNGYKLHAKVNKRTKVIENYEATPANKVDGQLIAELIDENDTEVYADSAYRGEKIANEIRAKNGTIKLEICERAERGHPLTEEQRKENKRKAKTRCRVEHVFGQIKNGFKMRLLRRVGLTRARVDICLTCIAYNMHRAAYLLRLREAPRDNCAH